MSLAAGTRLGPCEVPASRWRWGMGEVSIAGFITTTDGRDSSAVAARGDTLDTIVERMLAIIPYPHARP